MVTLPTMGVALLKVHTPETAPQGAINGNVNFKGNVTIASTATIENDMATDNSRMPFNFSGTAAQLVDIGATVKGINMNIKSGAQVQLTNNDLELNSYVSTTTTFTVESGGTLNFGWAADNSTPLYSKNQRLHLEPISLFKQVVVL